MNHRGLGERLFGLCLGFFIGCALLYAGVQLVRAVLAWVVVIGGTAAAIALLGNAIRWRRNRW